MNERIRRMIPVVVLVAIVTATAVMALHPAYLLNHKIRQDVIPELWVRYLQAKKDISDWQDNREADKVLGCINGGLKYSTAVGYRFLNHQLHLSVLLTLTPGVEDMSDDFLVQEEIMLNCALESERWGELAINFGRVGSVFTHDDGKSHAVVHILVVQTYGTRNTIERYLASEDRFEFLEKSNSSGETTLNTLGIVFSMPFQAGAVKPELLNLHLKRQDERRLEIERLESAQ